MNNNQVTTPVYIRGCGFHSALGATPEQIQHRLVQGFSPDMRTVSDWLNDGSTTVIGQVTAPLTAINEQQYPHQNTANNRLALSALQQISPQIQQAITQYGADRIAVIIGTTTSGISDGEHALEQLAAQGHLPEDYHYHQQEPANTGQFIADYFGLTGLVYTISTACSSSGRSFLSAKRLLKAGLADAVIVGGADTLCRLTLNGFHGLDSLSSERCNPFSANRNGINIGEAAAFMLLALTPAISEKKQSLPSQQQPQIAFLGGGDSSDAYHISAPHPEGNGAEVTMRNALADAGLEPDDIGYINAHGTATPLNDAMEAKAIARVFGNQVAVSSTKPLTGHTLGAASAVEAAICWYMLAYQLPLPIQINDGHQDPLLPITLVKQPLPLTTSAVLSNSFAFGGNNISLIFGYVND
ncbi:beta-ketoacyl-[acyl-carrier-protein] synthase family protein [Photobacterium phosphoreum]|uniref:beta-ketoacyl-[acyl-carrier-protein] synthase family protein n=1 Tax=Photobacterium phosphoreum TaxID=659 RepID=UPI001E3D469B|nr:beta-ketoacyl-[acyl-carrier-protein] synthase family protein [Photobacterium phosphoreum]MCD9469213.1 beta-ketoacyl-[acyl-carrier-protein] synthase II [Photobacterium phosphoreum]